MKLAGLRSVENAHDKSIWAATWVPATDSHPALLLTGPLDETVRLWRPDELAAAAPPSHGHVLGVVAAAAHPFGSLAAAASLDSSVRVFDVDSNASVASLDAPPSLPPEVWGLQFDPKFVLFFRSGMAATAAVPASPVDSLDYWRKFFRSAADADIFRVIEKAIRAHQARRPRVHVFYPPPT
ncbi:WD repeat-containing protein VIP3-like [Ananas comosus]|uniref:WD repeat-containing protein VIP3-like n=1 Tax=Ananas comosus TaxID=4615 RepID=A0A6P5FAM4_ANACO|nr:WD repeat-containing protein VIP3-like [Ananas comosus]